MAFYWLNHTFMNVNAKSSFMGPLFVLRYVLEPKRKGFSVSLRGWVGMSVFCTENVEPVSLN